MLGDVAGVSVQGLDKCRQRAEREPGSLPCYLFALLHLLRSSVWHRNQRPVNPERNKLQRMTQAVCHLQPEGLRGLANW